MNKIIIIIGLCTLFLFCFCSIVSAVDITNCTNLNTAGSTYYLINDISNSANDSCMNISNNNITLDCQGHTIDGNDVADYGIRISRSSAETTNITIKNCTVTDWDTAGIYLYRADGNYIWNTTVKSGTDDGIHLSRSNANEIRDSFLLNNTDWDFFVNPLTSTDCDNELINVTGTDNKPIVYYNYSITIDGWNNNISEIILCDADNSKINNLTLKRTDVENNGLLIRETDINISNSTFTDLYDGIYLANSDSNTFTNINVSSNSNDGIYLANSDSNILTNIIANSNTYGLYLYNSDSNILTNIIANSNTYGLYLYNSDSNTITNSTTNSNSRGIYLQLSDSNIINSSNINDNTVYGIESQQSDLNNFTNNIIRTLNNNGGLFLPNSGDDGANLFYNNLLNSTPNVALAFLDYNNSWNTSKQTGTNIYDTNNPYIGGNYWTNSSGDGYSDTCTDADYDGFCDSAYNVSSGLAIIGGDTSWSNVDYLPLSDEYVPAVTAAPKIKKFTIGSFTTIGGRRIIVG